MSRRRRASSPRAATPIDFDRTTALARLASDEFDVLVVGGGITGAGVALDAASRGLRTALVERHDFASGTSSRSSKLVHGGLRYLEQSEFLLVYEGLRERQIIRQNAPHLVRVLPFLVPILKTGGLLDRRLARLLGTAMWMYDLAGGWRIRRHQRINKGAALQHIPTLRADRLESAYLYYDCQADDARLTLSVVRTAAAYGAVVANYAALTSFIKDDRGKVTGATVEAEGAAITVRTRVVVNATGVWADDVRELDEGEHPAALRPAKGIHITLPRDKVRNDIAAVIPVQADERSIFVIPWNDETYVGTTDTDYDGTLDDPQCSPADIAYLLDALNDAIEPPVAASDILGTWAGLRPLLRDADSPHTADLSREHRVRVAGSNVVTVIGGKLTTYRRMAMHTVDQVMRLAGRRRRCRTKRLYLVGANGYEEPGADAPAEQEHLAHRYGTEAAVVADLVRADPRLSEPLVPGLPYLRAEAVFAVRHEMARTLDDVLARRTRARLLDRDASGEAAEAVAALVAPELGWDDAELARQVRAYRDALTVERAAASCVSEGPREGQMYG